MPTESSTQSSTESDHNDELWRAYRDTIFEADLPGGPLRIRIGEHHPALDEVLPSGGGHCWCFVTAWNPASKPLGTAENNARNAELAAALKSESLTFYAGRGRDPQAKWPAEESFLVLDLAREAARTLGLRYGQNAVVWGEAGGPAELLDSRQGGDG
jgi:hypothetical protein